MKRSDFSPQTLPAELRHEVSSEIWDLLETEIKYEGYIQRQSEQVAAVRKAETQQIPASINYAHVPGLRNEARQRLGELRPTSIGQAGRMSGVTPSDIGILTIWLKKSQATEYKSNLNH
jgi:tRNA uridine 5-carboxymethylaminomethyl modification enzyme